ncbi:MAG: hypothetical protein COA70_13250 [Planctomycetota bacterium]|nr:MAG: hypothetical protein COA70_13250 [Planctomycetota bacterium]
MTTQKQQLISLLKRKWVTPITAFNEVSCMRLAARISDIRAEGYVVEDKWVKTESGRNQFKAYRLAAEQPAKRSA